MANYTGTSGVDNVDVGSGSTNSADIINTYNGNDIVKAGGGNDVVDLGAGDDIVTGGAGNDTLRGGTGTDTAIFSGVWADYTITQNANGSFTVLDNRPGSPDGRDTLWSIEVFRFAAPGGSGTVDVPWTDVVLRDAPTASLIGADSNSAALDETNAPLTATGTLTVRDADVADTVTAAVQSVSASGPLGALTNPQLLAMFGVAPTGTGTSPLTADPTETSNLTWNFASTPIAFDYLATGQTLTLTYTITLTDTLSGLVTPTTVNITITGTNDAPTLGTVTAGSVAEDDQASTTTDTGLTGTLVGADVDGDTLTYGIQGGTVASGVSTLVGTYGTLTVNTATGVYTYTKNAAAIEALDASETDSDVFTMTVSDGDGPLVPQTYTVNVSGADDAPTLGTVTAGSVAEDDQASTTTDTGLTGTLVGADVDGDTLTYGIQGGTVASGVSTLVGTYGTLTVNTATGVYTYTKNAAAIEALDASETDSDVFTMTVSDGDGPLVPQTYTVNVSGADDAPTLGTVTAGSVAEDDQASTTTDTGLTGTLVGADVDGDTLTYGIQGGTVASGVSTLVGTYGTLTVNTATGVYTYTKNAAAIEALDASETDSDVFTMTVSDGDGPLVPQTYTVNVSGADDAPTLGTVTAGSVAEDDQASTTTDTGLTGTLVGADVDGDTLTYGIQGGTVASGVSTLVGTYGTLTVNTATGVYTYTKNAAAIEALDASETDSDVFTMTVSDGDGPLVPQTYTVNVSGADDAPTLGTVTAGSVAEDDQASTTTDTGLTGTLVGADVDGDTLTYGIQGGTVASGVSTLVGTYGTLTVNTATGVYTYTKNAAAIEALDASETDSDVFTMTVSDGDGPLVPQTYTVNVSGADDAPTLGTVTAGSVAEDDQASTTTDTGLTGTLVGADVDGDTLTYGIQGGTVASGVSTLVGTYGTLTVNTATGVYTYTKNAAAIEALDASETDSDVFTMTVSDGDGPLVPQTYTVNVSGADDAPTLGTVTAGSVAEDDQASTTTDTGLTGTLVGADVDGDTLTYGIQGGTVASGVSTLVGTYGTLTVNTATGVYTYTKNAAAIEALDASETDSDVFTMTVSDGDGPLVPQTYTVNVSGADDAPTLGTVTAGSVAEDDQASTTTDTGLTGTLVGADVDGDTLTYGIQGGTVASGVSTLVGTYGTLTVNTATGVYTYTKNAAAIEALDASETDSDVFTMTVSDGDGPLVPQTYTVNVSGADDAPTLGTVTAGSVAEDDQASTTTDTGLTGTLVGADVDGDTLTYGIQGGTVASGVSTLVGTYGTLTVNTATGVYTYTKNAAAIEALDASETDSDVFTMTVSDGDGPLVPQTYTVNVSGADDAPTLGTVTAGSVAEDDQASTTTDTGLTGTLVGADVDGDTLTYGIQGGTVASGVSTLVGTYGTLTVNTATGVYTYTKNAAAIEALDASETDSDVFTMTVSDGDGPLVPQTYTVNVSGADDAPTLGTVTAGSVAEDDQASTTTDTGLTGTLVGADVDGDTLTYGIQGGTVASGVSTLVGTYGTLTVNTATGVYTYTKNAAAIEALDASETDSDVFTMTVSDGDGPLVPQTYTVNVSGADDAPTLGTVTAGSVAEDDQASTTTDTGLTGTLVGADVDGDTLTYGIQGGTVASGVSTLVGTYGTLTVNTATGVYTYTKNAAAIEALDASETDSDVFTMTVSDGDGPLVPQTYTVNVSGADDAPTLGTVTAGSVAEDDQASTTTDTGLTGTLVGADVDGDTLTYGIQGGTVASGVSTLVGTYGTLTVNTATGVYTYTKNAAAIEALDASETDSDVFTMTVSDGDGPLVPQTYTVNVSGADDAPTLGTVTAGSVAEDDQASTTTDTGLTGTLVGADVDGDTLTYGIQGGTVASGVSTLVGTYGTLTVNTATGVYTYTKNAAAIEALDASETDSDVFTMTVSDGDGPLVPQTYTVNVSGADDAPTLGTVTAGSVAEDDQASTTTDTGLTGTLVGADVDGDTLTYGIQGGTVASGVSTLVGTYGTLTVNTATGVYTYTKNAAAIEALDASETDSDVFTMTVSDGDGPLVPQTYTVNVSGADDAPTLGTVTAGSVAEDDQASTTTDTGLTGTLVGADVDGDTLTYGIQGGTVASGVSTLVGTYGTLTVNTATGVYTYTKNAAAIEALDASETDSDVFTMTVSDGDGPLVPQTYTVNVSGADDAPTLGTVTAGSVAEDDQASTTTDTGLTGTLVGADVDGDTLTYGIQGGTVASGVSTLVGTYGTLTVNTATGVYTYTKNAAAIEALDASETDSDVFTMTVSDGDGPLVPQTYTVNVSGADDAPTLGTVTAGSVAEDDQASTTTDTGLTGTLVGADVDGDTLTYGIQGGTVASGVSTLVGTYGTLTVNTATGVYTYTKNAAAIEALDASETDSDVFTMTVSDGDGPLVPQTYTVNVSGADDAPTLGTVTAGSVAEDDQASTTTDTGLTGTLVGADVDGDTLTYGIQGGTVASGVSTLVGTYGTLTVNTATGVYTYTKNAAAIEALDASETDSDVFTMTVSDGDGPLVPQTYTVNVSGADDAPTLGTVTAGSVAEDDQASTTTDTGLTGTLVGADVDGDTLTYGIQGGTVASGVSTLVGTYGTLTVNTATGVYTYTKNAAAIEALDASETDSDVFTMTVSDGDGPLVPQTYTVNVSGADDAPTLGTVTAGSVAEDDQASTTTDTGLTGTLVGADVDGDTLTYGIQGGTVASGVSTLVGTYGTLTVNTATGVYTYTKNAAAIEALDASETDSDVFTMTVSDGDGPLVPQTYTVNVSGADDAPTLGTVTAGSVAEDDQASTTTDTGLTGTLVGADVDGDTLTYGIQGGTVASGVSTLVGTYGTLTVNTATGVYTYTKNAAAIEALDASETDSDVFTMTVSDGDGPLVPQTYTVNVSGADDAPTLGTVTAGSVAEDDQASTTTDTGLTGTLVGADVDGDTLTYGIQGGTVASGVSTLVGTYGTLTVNTATGVYTYTKNAAAIEALDASETDSDVFTMTVSDGDGPLVPQTYTVNVSGADDAPTLGTVTAGSVAEDDQASTTTDTGLTGTLVGADVDGDTLTYGIQGGTVASGVSTLVGTYGTLTVNTATGVYTYTKNAAAIEALDASETDSDVFTMTVSDGDGPLVPQTYTVNVSGADDAPTLGTVTAGSVAEDDQASTTTDTGLTGTLVGADVDGDTLTYGIQGGTVASGVSTLVGTYGTLTVNTATGVYTYTKNAAAIEALDASETDSDVFTMTVSDGDGPLVPQTYTVNVSGADDAPTLGTVTAGSVAEDDQASTTTDTGLTGTLVGADVDGDTLTYGIQGGTVASGVSTLVGTYGTLTVNTATGVYTYTKNAAAIEALDASETDSDVFTMTVSDGDGPLVPQTYTVNVSGADDAPTLGTVTAGSVAEDDQASTTTDTGLTGTLVGADVDGDTLTYGIQGGTVASGVSTLVGTYGTLTVNTATGVYTYTKNAAAIEALDASETDSDVFTMTVSDGDGPLVPQTYTVNVSGADDAPTLGTVTAGSVAEDDQASTTTDTGLTGTLVGADVDGDTLTYGIQGGTVASGVSTLVGTYGTLTVNTATGVYTYTKNAAAIEALDASETDSDVFTMTVSDGDGPLVPQTYTVNVSGADDAPTLGTVTAGSVAEDDQASTTTDTGLTGTLVGADVDGDTLTYGIQGGTVASGVSTLVGTYGTLTVNTATGVYTYTKNAAAIEALDASETDSDVFTMTVSDGDGPLVPQTYTVNVSGADDAPTIDLDVDNSSTATGADYAGAYTANGAGVAIVDTDSDIADVDNGSGVSEATIVLSNAQIGDLLATGSLPPGVTATFTTSGGAALNGSNVVTTAGIVTLTLTASPALALAAFESVLEAITFSNTSGNPITGDRTISVTVTDDQGTDSNTATSTITVGLDLTQPVHVLNGSGNVVATFATIQGAIDAIGDGVTDGGISLAGISRIVVEPTGTTYTASEDLVIDVPVSIEGGSGVAGDVVIRSITIQDGALDGATEAVTVKNVTVQGGATLNGITFTDADGNAEGTLTLDNVSVSGFSHNGLFVNSASGLTDITVNISNSSFTNNSTGGASGSMDLHLFNFAGDATLTNVNVSNTGSLQYGIAIQGWTGSSAATGNVEGAIGAIDINNVTVAGTYAKALVYINGYNEFSGLDLTGGLNLNGSAGWTGLYVQPQSIGGTFPTNPTNTLDLTGVTAAVTGAQIFGGPILAVGTLVGVDTITGSGAADIIRGLGGADIIDAAGGADAIILDQASQTAGSIEGGLGADTVLVHGAQNFTFASDTGLSGVETIAIFNGPNGSGLVAGATNLDLSVQTEAFTVLGNSFANTIVGGTNGDTISGGGGDDTVTGGGGNDIIDGGAGNVDVAVYSGAITESSITLSGSGWSVAAGGEGTDTLTNVEVVDGAGAGRFLLVGNGGYATIQAAIDAAVSGDTILIAEGVYTEDLTITDKAIALVGVGDVDLNGNIAVSDDMAAADVLRIANIDINATGEANGISVLSSSADIPGVNGGTIILDGVTVTGASQIGFFYAHPANGSSPLNPNTVGTISILNSTFIDNGHLVTGSRGQGHVNLFGFNGNLTVDNVTMTGPATNLGDSTFRGGSVGTGGTANPDKAFSVTGIRTGTPGVGGYVDAGNLVLNDVTVTGNYSTDVISFYTIQSFASATVTDVSITARGPWGLVNFDNFGGTIDLSDVTGTNSAPSGIVSTLQGLASDNVFTGTSGADVLLGRGGADTLYGGDGNDIIDGGTGADFMFGDGNNDTYVVDNAGDTVTELDGEGTDTVNSSITYTLGDYVENLTLTGSADIDGTGNGLDNVITGNSGNNVLSGGAGTDTINAGGGDDEIDGGAGADIIDAGDGEDLVRTSVIDSVGDSYNGGSNPDSISVDRLSVSGSDGDNLAFSSNSALQNIELIQIEGTQNISVDLTGQTEDLTVEGNSGNNTFTSGSGSNIFTGFGGNDTYYVNPTDTVSENDGEGTDSVISSGGYTLAAGSEIESLSTTSGAGVSLTGNEFGQTITGGAGIDTLTGGDGDDIYIVQNTGDSVIEIDGEGNDTVRSSVSFTLAPLASIERLEGTGSDNINLFGNEFDQEIIGNSGNNEIRSGAGADYLDGGDGNDTYRIVTGDHTAGEASADRYDDTGTGGTDVLINAASANFYVTELAGIEQITFNNRTMLGTANADSLDFSTVTTFLTTGGTADVQTGAGNDTVYGANVNGSGGSAMRFDLGADEDEFFGGDANEVINGDAGDDYIRGGGGNDTITGGAGADDMDGGDDSDLYILSGNQATGDLISDSGSTGTDTVRITGNLTAATGLALDLSISGVESLDLFGANRSITGSNSASLADSIDLSGIDNIISSTGVGPFTLTINGQAGDDTISGTDGGEVIIGGAGSDNLTGNDGADVFRYTSRNELNSSWTDIITDFVQGSDVLSFRSGTSSTQFGNALAELDANTGTLDSVHFASLAADGATTSVGADVRFIFDESTNTLYYDPSGGTSTGRLLVAELENGVTLTASDIKLY